MKEVLSVPGGETQEIVKKYLVHAHPYPRSYKESKFITIREKGGIMNALYSVQCEMVLRPQSHELDRDISFLHEDTQKRLKGYINERATSFGFGEKEEYKFYLLHHKRVLKHLPRTSVPLVGHTYFTLGELTSGREIVQRESELNK